MSSIFGGGMGFTPTMGASGAQAQELYKQQQDRLLQQQQFVNALQAQSPQAIAAQQQLLKQLQGQAMGTAGPSVAQRQLAETTAENAQRQAALMASQRGASANLGLLARNISDVGAGAQQQAARQAATLRAQEQLAAQQGLAGLTGQQLGQIGQAQQTGLAGTTAAQQNVLNAIAESNRAREAASKQQGGILGGLAGAVGTVLGGPLGGAIGSGIGSLFGGGSRGSNISDYTSLAHGGKVQGYAEGGEVEEMDGDEYLRRLQDDLGKPAPVGVAQNRFAQGGVVPAMVSPGERYLPPAEVKKVKDGEKAPHKAGEKIPGQAKVAGDSLKNDTVKKNLKEGGIVIPRSVMQSDNAEEKARQFVAAILARQQGKRK